MPKYKAIARGFIGRIVEEGEEFEFDGPQGSWMEKIEQGEAKQSEAKPAKDKAKQ